MLTHPVLYYGKEEPPAERIDLEAGPLAMLFEPNEGFLRYIRVGHQEVLRGIYAAVRDRNWGTVPPRLSNLKLEKGEQDFRLTFDVLCKQREIDFFWQGSIAGDSGGSVTFAMRGVARSTFLRNRIGLCVLHPILCAGVPCTVEKVDGTVIAGKFPKSISPHQPFREMRAITHEVTPKLRAEVRMEGDSFEMEDQRNWTDASYKTYCTPLRIPYPVEVPEGTLIEQSVTLTLRGEAPAGAGGRMERTPVLTVTTAGKSPVALPRIGVGMASHGQGLTDRELDRLKALNLAHLRADVRLSEPGWQGVLHLASDQAKALGAKLEAALFLSDDAETELRALAGELERLRPAVAAWLVFHVREKSTTEQWVRLARRRLSGYDARVPFASGTNAYFTELNRERPPAQALDQVCYSINPQVHAFDNSSLVETLAAQAETVASARQFVGELPVAVTPVTLRPRFNPNAAGPAPEPGPGELPEPVDVRQMSLFGAGWTLGSLRYLSESGVASVTFYETTGWRGVMETEAGSPVPERFRSIRGGVFPLYHVLADAGEFAGGEVIPAVSSDILAVDGLMLRQDGKARVLLANLSPERRRGRINLAGLAGTVFVKVLDETNAEQAMREPEAFRSQPALRTEAGGGSIEFDLRPYAVARLDWEEGG